MVDTCSLLNTISVSILEAVESIETGITSQPIEVSGFRGNTSLSLSFINLDMTIEIMRAAISFYVIYARSLYHFAARETLDLWTAC